MTIPDEFTIYGYTFLRDTALHGNKLAYFMCGKRFMLKIRSYKTVEYAYAELFDFEKGKVFAIRIDSMDEIKILLDRASQSASGP